MAKGLKHDFSDSNSTIKTELRAQKYIAPGDRARINRISNTNSKPIKIQIKF